MAEGGERRPETKALVAPKERVRAGDLSADELMRLASHGYPPALQRVMLRSEVLAVEPPAQYNWEMRGTAGVSRAAEHGTDREAIQKAAREPTPERTAPNVVTMKLKEPVAVSQLHRVDSRGEVQLGRWFSTHAVEHPTPGGAVEDVALPSRGLAKTHESWGVLRPGAIVCLSEMSPRSYGLEAVSESGRTPDAVVRTARVGENPPLAQDWAQSRFQLELKGRPEDSFLVRGTRKLTSDPIS